VVHAVRMLSRVRSHFQGAKFARMSSGTYCIIRDLGLVKGGKGMRHHEVLVTFSLASLWRSIGLACSELVGVVKRRSGWLRGVRDGLRTDVRPSAMTEEPSPQ
jgi:hypothetical protein